MHSWLHRDPKSLPGINSEIISEFTEEAIVIIGKEVVCNV